LVEEEELIEVIKKKEEVPSPRLTTLGPATIQTTVVQVDLVDVEGEDEDEDLDVDGDASDVVSKAGDAVEDKMDLEPIMVSPHLLELEKKSPKEVSLAPELVVDGPRLSEEPIDPFGFHSGSDNIEEEADLAEDFDRDEDYSSASRPEKKSPPKAANVRKGVRPNRGQKRKAIDLPPDSPRPKRAKSPEQHIAQSGPAQDREGKDIPPGIFEGLVFRISKQVDDAENLAAQVVAHGGVVLQYTTKHTTHFVATQDEFDEYAAPIQAAVKRQLPIVSHHFIVESTKAARRLQEADFLLGERRSI
jgi:hypothetical protein